MIIIIIIMIIIVLMGCPQNFQVLVRPTPLLVRSRPLLYPPPPPPPSGRPHCKSKSI